MNNKLRQKKSAKWKRGTLNLSYTADYFIGGRDWCYPLSFTFIGFKRVLNGFLLYTSL